MRLINLLLSFLTRCGPKLYLIGTLLPWFQIHLNVAIRLMKYCSGF